jgi:hypothetical protein
MAYVGTPLTQSRFYSPAFNAAIFDGPVRIYFAQHQEPIALRVYFRLQERLKGFYENLSTTVQSNLPHVFVMLYPSQDTFDLSFENGNSSWPPAKLAQENWGEDYVIGVVPNQRDEDSQFEELYSSVEHLLTGPMA